MVPEVERLVCQNGRDAWQTVKQKALANGVELSLSRNGKVQALSVSSTQEVASRRRYPGDDQRCTLAETIEFVFAQGGSFAFAMKMWSNEMVETC